ncbi:hypothetical protein Egran_01628 [Elaphomyces granulatus]|uniref:Zn(2)-C6 fungal-type domain-containing protein n=1 Tax=Elaphomyces granulatus TaxID=519963 RepID=A0A232M2G4_9EURO|nr:hypothetical protein Egran_01628 [Elaphomyces granulatus]
MPGILPMKVIKVGNNSQSRIAQACDRCRSKKIRCDGIRPCCTQCANVGFECRTSDKLSRRAFPRGYTESLEDRVRTLEAEVRDLKELLDQRDEKIEVLSRIRSLAPCVQKCKSSQSPVCSPSTTTSSEQDVENAILVQLPSTTRAKPTADAPFMGPSSTHMFADMSIGRLQEQRNSPSSLSTRALTSSPRPVSHLRGQTPGTVPRLVSDGLIHIFFQEWAPFYPVVHQPTVLKYYDNYLTGDTDSVQANSHVVAQLNLIFGIAALSSKSRTNQDPSVFERCWYPALEALSGDISVMTLQCYVLAQMYSLAKRDYKSLSRYRGLAVCLCHQLGLYQSQSRFTLDTLSSETRKRVFWCQYVLDRFSAALTGLPVLLREKDINVEYPADVDDENITEAGFLPVPRESTGIAAALAFFDASRILNKVLEQLYPSAASYEIPFSKLRVLADGLDAWLRKLPLHLRLKFAQDKPSTDVTSHPSLFLSTVYFFIRMLIHRPAACFGHPEVASPSILALSDSSKHIIQILQLLDERRMSLSFCVNRTELIFLSGLGLLWQTIGLERNSKLVKESRNSLSAVVDQLKAESSEAAAEFGVIINHFVFLNGDKVNRPATQPKSQETSSSSMKSLSPKKQLQSLKSRLLINTASGKHPKKEAAYHSPAFAHSNAVESPRPHASLYSPIGPPAHLPQVQNAHLHAGKHRSVDFSTGYSDDYYTLGYDSTRAVSCSNLPRTLASANWEFMIGDLDRENSNIFNSIYGTREFWEDHIPLIAEYQQVHQSTVSPQGNESNDIQDLPPRSWSTSSGDLLYNLDTSVLSSSEKSPVSAEDIFSASDLSSQHPENFNVRESFKGMMIPVDDIDDFGVLNIWDQ